MVKVKWVRPQYAEQGDWVSSDGRFYIVGSDFWGGERPTKYSVRDTQSGDSVKRKTVCQAKLWAQDSADSSNNL